MKGKIRGQKTNNIVVVVTSNKGKELKFGVASLGKAAAVVKQHAHTDNHMICVEIDGERTDRFDRERFKGENCWHRTDPGELEIIGSIRTVTRVWPGKERRKINGDETDHGV